MEHPQVNDAATLDRERPYLIGIAYRMLGSRSDAEDVVQEALLRAVRHEDALRTPRAFLTTVVTRLCLDELGSARRRREDYVGPYFPEPVLTDRLDVGEDPTEYRESVSVALLLVLDKLSPAERAVFVLRDVFDLDYEVIAEALQRSEASCRKLLQRAREQLVDAQHQQPAAAAERRPARLDRGVGRRCQHEHGPRWQSQRGAPHVGRVGARRAFPAWDLEQARSAARQARGRAVLSERCTGHRDHGRW
jgi:RNA polymerase sigma-70 factor (ECF subfamily)